MKAHALQGPEARSSSLAARAGADMDLVGRWITVGVKRGEDIQATRQFGRGTFISND